MNVDMYNVVVVTYSVVQALPSHLTIMPTGF